MESHKNAGNAPEKKFSAGAISAAVWKNEAKNKAGEVMEFKTITLQRTYKDKDNRWQHTNSLRLNDLPRASLVLQKAYEYLLFKEGSGSQDNDIMIEEVM